MWIQKWQRLSRVTRHGKRPITLVFPHIPKSGGTSILKFVQSSRKSIFLDYDHPPHYLKFFDNACRLRNREFQKLDFSAFDMIYGHFPIERYRSKQFGYICLLRHPVERAISHFNYWKHVVRDPVGIAKNPIIDEIQKGEVCLIEFARRCSLATFYKSYLGYRMDDYLLVGFTDRIDDFGAQLGRLLGGPEASLGRERQNVQKDVVQEKELVTLHELLAEEIAYYEAMKRKYGTGQDCRQGLHLRAASRRPLWSKRRS